MKHVLAPDPDRVALDLNELAAIGGVAGGGVSRIAFSAEDMAARDYMARRLYEANVEVRVDAVGNIFGRRSGKKAVSGCVLLGSHIDTTLLGGRFDGAVGVVGALEVMRIFNDRHILTDCPLEAVVFAAEESARFDVSQLGSKATSGRLRREDLHLLRDDRGVTLWEALERAELSPERLDACGIPRGYARAYLELHIEQGGVLDSLGKAIGVVTAIAGTTRGVVTVRGQAGHSGTTPMAFRRDALTAAAEMVLALEKSANEQAGDVVATVGRLDVYPGALNTIPGEVRFTVDVRSIDAQFNRGIFEVFNSAIDLTAKKRGLTVELVITAEEDPVAMSPVVVAAIAAACRDVGIEPHFMTSGAGHDAQEVARYTDVGMIFVPSKCGVSHSPDEYTSLSDICAGIQILARAVMRVSSENIQAPG